MKREWIQDKLGLKKYEDDPAQIGLKGLFKRCMVFAAVLVSPLLSAETLLTNLLSYSKTECVDALENASTADLWDIYLEKQADLYFKAESEWLASNGWWSQAKMVLDIGSGNGAYTARLSQRFPEKVFAGMEKSTTHVENAVTRTSSDDLAFWVGDAEEFAPSLEESQDAILFRLTLQHLNDPIGALYHAYRYLHSKGHVVIVESFDTIHECVPPISTVQDATRLAAKAQENGGKGNRTISYELLKSISSGPDELGDLFEVVYSSLDIKGEVLHDPIRLEGDDDREKLSDHALLFLTLFQRTYGIPVDLEKAFDEILTFREDEGAWVRPGLHLLVLRKKS